MGKTCHSVLRLTTMTKGPVDMQQGWQTRLNIAFHRAIIIPLKTGRAGGYRAEMRAPFIFAYGRKPSPLVMLYFEGLDWCRQTTAQGLRAVLRGRLG